MQKEIVTAAEIGEFVYCPEAWRLAHTGHESANQFARRAGTAHHQRKAVAERVAGSFVALGRVLIVAGLLGSVLVWCLSR